MNLAVIPARGGSKRIPGKNIRDFCRKPIIAWAIETAKTSGLFDHVIVSTDEPRIADVAQQWGAEVPFQRPADLSDDHAGTTAVIAHATRWAMERGWALRAVCCVYPTAPTLRADDLQKGIDALMSGRWDYAFAATVFAAPIFRAFKRREDGGVEMFFPEHAGTRSQDLPVALHDAGQFYWGRPESWLENRPIFGRYSIPVMIPRWRVEDIDVEDDWHRAELLFEQLRGRGE